MPDIAFPPPMPIIDPPTHRVSNQPAPREEYNLYANDVGLRETSGS